MESSGQRGENRTSHRALVQSGFSSKWERKNLAHAQGSVGHFCGKNRLSQVYLLPKEEGSERCLVKVFRLSGANHGNLSQDLPRTSKYRPEVPSILHSQGRANIYYKAQGEAKGRPHVAQTWDWANCEPKSLKVSFFDTDIG